MNSIQISNELPSDNEERQRHAQSEDISLQLPEEVNPELLEIAELAMSINLQIRHQSAQQQVLKQAKDLVFA